MNILYKIYLIWYQLICKHHWKYTTINYIEKGRECVMQKCKKCGKERKLIIKGE